MKKNPVQLTLESVTGLNGTGSGGTESSSTGNIGAGVICKRCLIQGVDREAFQRNLRAYVDSLPESEKANVPLYQSRLLICDRCAHLLEGMCRKCGCFVEARAAKRTMACPAPEHYW